MGSLALAAAALTLLMFRGASGATTCTDNGCTCVAFQPLSRSLTCNHECSTENATVYWNLYRSSTNYNITFWWDGSPRYDSHTSSAVNTIVRQIQALEDGQLVIEKVNIHVHDADYTCWAVLSNGTLCGITDSFHLTVISLFTDTTEKPKVLGDEGDAIYGAHYIACFHGVTPGINGDGTYWEKEGVGNEIAKNVSAECPTCTDCSPQAIGTFLTLPSIQSRLQAGYSHSAFVISISHEVVEGRDYSRCLTIENRYITFLVVREVKDEDVGDWTATVMSAYNVAQSARFKIRASYKQIETKIERLQDWDLTSEENEYIVCNATHTINFDARLNWMIQHGRKSVLTVNATVMKGGENLASSPVSLTKDQLRDLCSWYGPPPDEEDVVGFSLDYAPDAPLRFNGEEHDGALVQRQFLVLVLCNIGIQQIGTYTCIAPGNENTARREQSMDVKVSVPRSTSGTRVDVGAIGGVAAVGVVIILIIILLVYFGIRRYRQLKYEAMQMRPMSIPLAATQLANAINHAFSSFSPIGSPMYDKFEFSRENLMLLEVIGEGQFGQVWRARAIGICNEDSRNIVAVKTLKDNYRDSDYFDLRSELDIMKSMEPHPNIINLLGVCSEIGSSSLCILMEYAAYGSMKDYLAYCRRVMQAHAEGLASPSLEEAYPLAAACNEAILRQSMLMGDYPQLQQLGVPAPGAEPGLLEGNDYLYDPMVAARSRRLIKMLKVQGYSPEEASGEGPPTYNHLAPSGAEAAGVSLYDKLYPNSQCVYRPCLEAYNYACYRGAQQGRRDHSEQEYYNAAVGDIAEEEEEEEEGEGVVKVSLENGSSPVNTSPPAASGDTVQLIRASPTPQVTITDGPSTPPPPSASVSTPVRSKKKLGPVLSSPQVSSGQDLLAGFPSLSASQDNVFESPSGSTNLMAPSKEHLRESMISFPDGYIYAPPPTEGEPEAGMIIAGAAGGREPELAELRKEKEPAPPMEDMVTNLDMIDFALQIARGMDHLERMQCVHRDLAARNILISEDFTLKIGDFGLARDLSDKDYYRKVTPGRLPARWMAPESLQERTHTFQSDVWSYAVVMWEILTYGEVPYRGQQEANDCDHLAYYLRTGNRLLPPPNTSDEFRDLLTSCWMLNPDKRPSFSEIVSILDNQLSAAHGYLTMASAPVDRSSLHDQAGSANPSPRMQKRKAMLQKLDKLHGADRPVSLQPGAFSKSKLAKSPSLPIAEPLKTSPSPSAPPPTSGSNVSPYLLPTPTLKVPAGGTLLSAALPPGTSPSLHFQKYGSNPELSFSGRDQHPVAEAGREPAVDKPQNGSVKANGHAGPGAILKSIETQL